MPSAPNMVALLLALLLAGGCGPRVPSHLADPPVPTPPATLTVAIASMEQRVIGALPAGAGRELAMSNCLICHRAAIIVQQRKDSTAWNKTVTLMMAWGAPLPAAQKSLPVAYLVEHYGVRGVGR